MAVIETNITNRAPYAEDRRFGDTGEYERIDGILTCAVDPAHEANQAIVDLDLAPRDDQNRACFYADFTLLCPQVPARGNQRLIVDVVNRGRKRIVSTFNRASDPADTWEIPPGDGFLFHHGFSVVSIGWQWDVHRSKALLGLEAPRAEINGQPIHGQAVVEIRPNKSETTRLLANRNHQPHPVPDLNDPESVLLMRDWEDGPDTVIPRDQWSFACESDDGVKPSHEHIHLPSGFQAGKIYNIVYTAQGAPIAGTGLLAVRDVATWLRHPSDLNPIAEGFERVWQNLTIGCLFIQIRFKYRQLIFS